MKFKSGQRGILFQIEVWNLLESFVSFKHQVGTKDPLSAAAD